MPRGAETGQSSMIELSYLKSRLHYDPRTGIWIWITSPRSGWKGKTAGWDRNGYIVITIDKKDYTAHQLAWLYMTGVWPDFILDHEDNVKSNNRWSNLRPADKTKNAQNSKRHKNNKCGFKGVWKRDGNRSKPYYSSIRVDGKTIDLKSHRTAEEAHAAYIAAAIKYFGKYARLT